MEKAQVLERPQIKLESLKWGVPNINTGYSFDQAIRFVKDVEKISSTTVKIFLGTTPSAMEIGWSRKHIITNRLRFEDHAFITDKTPEQVTHAKGKRNGFLPHDYLVAVERNIREIIGKSVYPTYTISIYAEEDGRREFLSKVRKILGEFPQDWTF